MIDRQPHFNQDSTCIGTFWRGVEWVGKNLELNVELDMHHGAFLAVNWEITYSTLKARGTAWQARLVLVHDDEAQSREGGGGQTDRQYE